MRLVERAARLHAFERARSSTVVYAERPPGCGAAVTDAARMIDLLATAFFAIGLWAVLVVAVWSLLYAEGRREEATARAGPTPEKENGP